MVEGSPRQYLGVARAGNMAAPGFVRCGDAGSLWAAGADFVVTSLDEGAVDE